ncbi:hypothetical protein B0H14DRAFT_475319 [Mycena olivaceomarginata]|nr:hypothetical protein B0H14DRAFT_475319 [Mycena olivaceomarginata]
MSLTAPTHHSYFISFTLATLWFVCADNYHGVPVQQSARGNRAPDLAPSPDELRDKNPPSTGVAFFDYQHFRLCASLPFERSFVRLEHHFSRGILERNCYCAALTRNT